MRIMRVVVGLLLLLTVQVMSRGGGRSSGGSRSYSRSYSSSHYYHSGGGGGPLPTWAIILIVGVVVAIALCYLCYAISDDDEQIGHKPDVQVEGNTSGFSRSLSYGGSIPCYLCLKKVRNLDWDTGDHRRKCAFFNQRELLGFGQPYQAFCPNCSEKLRLWPAKGVPFYCDECPFNERGVSKRSTGHNRLNCFMCDYDTCVDCSNRKAEIDAKEISDEEINRLSSAMAVDKMVKTETQNKQHAFNPHKFASTNTTEVSDAEMTRLASAIAVDRMIETEHQYKQPTYDEFFSTNSTIIPMGPVDYNAKSPSPGQVNYTPFVVPQEYSPPADHNPAECYQSTYTSPFVNPSRINTSPSSTSSLPYHIQPLSLGGGNPSQPSSLPYLIQPPKSSGSTPAILSSTSSEWKPSAPPLISKY